MNRTLVLALAVALLAPFPARVAMLSRFQSAKDVVMMAADWPATASHRRRTSVSTRNRRALRPSPKSAISVMTRAL